MLYSATFTNQDSKCNIPLKFLEFEDKLGIRVLYVFSLRCHYWNLNKKLYLSILKPKSNLFICDSGHNCLVQTDLY